MEFLNRIELRGVVGRADINTYNTAQVCNFSVVVENSGIDRDGNSIVEPTWFNVTAWSGRPEIPDLYGIQKGCWIQVIGRLRVRKYVTQENEERTALDVLARKIQLLPREEIQMSPQRDW